MVEHETYKQCNIFHYERGRNVYWEYGRFYDAYLEGIWTSHKGIAWQNAKSKQWDLLYNEVIEYY